VHAMHTKLRLQPDLILDEAGFWVLGGEDGDGGEQRRSAVMYSRASPDAADAAANTRRIQDRQRGSKKRL